MMFFPLCALYIFVCRWAFVPDLGRSLKWWCTFGQIEMSLNGPTRVQLQIYYTSFQSMTCVLWRGRCTFTTFLYFCTRGISWICDTLCPHDREKHLEGVPSPSFWCSAVRQHNSCPGHTVHCFPRIVFLTLHRSPRLVLDLSCWFLIHLSKHRSVCGMLILFPPSIFLSWYIVILFIHLMLLWPGLS